MTTIAELGVRVTSDGAIDAANDLDRLVEAGSRAEKSAAGVEQSSRRTGQALKEHAKETVEAAAAFRKLHGGASAAEAGFFSLGNAIEKGNFVRSLNASKEADKWLASLSAATKDAGASFLEAGSKLTLLSTGLSGLGAWTGPGAPVFGQIGKQSTAAAVGVGEFGRTAAQTEMSAKAMQAALRGVPAQFTDIIVSLQGGMSPLTVLLQQGGQLKDMFGGAGPAAKALGGYVLGLVNPFTVAAAAMGALGLAYYQGSEEQDSFRQSLVTTGNAAGATTAGLAAMARQVSATVGTTGAAAAVLSQLAGTGKIVSSSFEQIAIAALSFEKATGRAASETVAEFAKLADDPVKAVVALNEKYHFLTAAVFSQIHALQEQGDTLGAQQVAEGAYADALTKRAEEIQRNLGYVERAWDSAKGAAKGAWDAFLDIGREETFEDKLRQLEQRANIGAGGLGGGLLSGFEASQGSKAEIGKEWTGVLQQEVDDQARARAAMFEAEAVERGTKAYQALQKAIDSTAPKSEKLKKALDDNRRQIEEARRAGYTITADQEAALEAQTKAKFKPTAGRSSAVDLSSFNDQKNALNSILSEYKNSQKELDAAQKAGLISQEEYAAQRAAIIQQQKAEVTNAYEAEIKALEEAKGRSSTSAQQRIQLDQKIADARAAMVKAQKDADTELSVLATNEQGRLKKQAMAVQTYTDALDQQVKALRLQGQRAAVGVGLGDRQRTLQDQQNGITDQINQQRRTLADQYGDGSRGMSLDEYNKKLAALQRTEDDLHQTAIRNYDDLTVAQSDWSAGASAAWQNYQNQALNVAGQMQSAFTSLYDGLTDAAVEWAFGAEETFGDVAVSFAKMLAKMAVQAAASNVFSSILGTVGTSLIGAGAGAAASAGSAGAGGFDFGLGGASSGMTYTPTFSDGGFTGPGGKYEPAGIVHGGEFVLRKEVVSQPGMLDWLETLNTRGYADGGLVGSFTPQAIPRQISSASGSNPVVIQQEITVEGGGGQASASTNDMGAVAQAYAKAAKDGAQQEIAKQLKRGGMIWTAINRPVR